MLHQKLFEEINGRLAQLPQLPLMGPARDLEKNLKAVVAAALGRLDLVTREEFDVQQEVLLRTREKLAGMEARIAELEALLQARNARADGGQD